MYKLSLNLTCALSLMLTIGLYSNSSYGRMPTCKEVLVISQQGANFHINNMKIDEKIISRSAEVFLDIQDPAKVYLLEDEVKKAVGDFSSKSSDILAKLKDGDCSAYKNLEDIAKKGKERWDKYLEEALNDAKIIEAPEVDRNSGNLKAFKTEEELKKYSNYYVGRYVKLELANNKKIEQIKKDFKEANQKSKKVKKKYSDDELRNDLITKSLFLSLDPHSDYISEDQATDFEINMTANLQGVGLVLGDDTVGAKIIKVVKNGPADKSGKFKKNDIITKINGKEISNLPLSDIVDLIRGKKGTSVKLSASREDSKTKKITKFEVSLTRDIVPLMDQKAKADEFTIDGKRIVVINLPGFYYDTASQVGSAYDIMEQYNNMKKKGNIDAIVLDLRYNGGGVLEEAIRVSGIFIEKPISVQVRDTSGVRRFQSASPPVLIKEPLVVLISRVSASASEIVAGALKDYGRAVIVGDDRTYGKGTVQSVIGSLRSAQLGMIKVTTGKFYTPEGGSTQIKGVTSDVKIPSSTQIQDFGETNMRFALDWTRVDSVFNKSSSSPLSNLINELGKNSSNRVKSNADFERFKDMSSYRKWSEAQKKEDESEDEEVSRINPEKDLVLKESLNIAKDLSILIKPKEVSSSPVSK